MSQLMEMKLRFSDGFNNRCIDYRLTASHSAETVPAEEWGGVRAVGQNRPNQHAKQ